METPEYTERLLEGQMRHTELNLSRTAGYDDTKRNKINKASSVQWIKLQEAHAYQEQPWV